MRNALDPTSTQSLIQSSAIAVLSAQDLAGAAFGLVIEALCRFVQICVYMMTKEWERKGKVSWQDAHAMGSMTKKKHCVDL